MRDAGLERYVSAIEEHLGRRRGREHALSPPDFALARRWHATGVPVGDVIAAIDALVAEGRDPTSLAPCQRQIEVRPGRAPLHTEGPGPTPEAGGGAERMQDIEAVLDSLDTERAACFDGTRAALEALRREPAAEVALLERLEQTLAREAVAALPRAEREAIERRVDRAAERQRGRVTAEALEHARRRHLEAAALRTLGLPLP